jgi:superfamily II DNA or RNA helicase
VFQDARVLVERGLVQEASYEPPVVTGSILWSNRPLRTAVKLLPDGTAENQCPCRDSTERGVICAHVIAVCLALSRRSADPVREANRQAELRHAARMARLNEGVYLARAAPGTPGAIPAELRITLQPGWREAARTQRVPVRVSVLVNGASRPLDQVSRDVPLALSPPDEALLYVLEDIAGGPPPSAMALSVADFLSVLHLHRGRTLCENGGSGVLTVEAIPLTSHLRLDLDRETGELIAMLHTELPFDEPGVIPTYLAAGRSGWVFGADHVWPLEAVLPDPLQGLYAGPITVPRPSVPRFVREELPVLAGHVRIESDLTPDLFTIDPAVPRFVVALRGSPASLAGTLFAFYDGVTLVAGKPDPAGQFALPDPDDLLRYRVRNHEAEAAALDAVGRSGLRGERGDALSPVVGCREVLNFLGQQVPALRRRGWRVQFEGRLQTYMDAQEFVVPIVRVTQPAGGGWFDVAFEFEGPDRTRITMADVQRALRKGESFLDHGGRTLLLDGHAIQSMLDVFGDCASGEGAQPGTFRLPMVYAAYVRASLEALDGVDVELERAWSEAADRQGRRLAADPVELPPALEPVLRPYQKEGVQWLRLLESNLFGGVLADEMGLGKTLQTLAWLALERLQPAAQGHPALVVCPTSLVENWAEEAARFVPQLKVLPLTGGDRHSRWDEIGGADLVITSYALVRRDAARYLDQQFAVVVLDEAQHIKNRSTLNAITAKQLAACHRLVLTGTPIENRVGDLWSIMDFLMPGYLGSAESFRRHCELPVAEGGLDGEAAQVKLRRKLQPFLLRRLKTDVARDLPPRIERIAACSLTADQRAVYRGLLESSRRELAERVARHGFQRCRMDVLKTLLRLRQVCCHLDLLHLPDLHPEAPSGKMDLFFELLDEALDAGHRVLVFSQFVAMLTILRRAIEERSMPHCYLDGATTDRQSVVHTFNSDRRIPLFLISLKAGGTGLNLTGADMVIHFDPWWNPAVEDQATDRAHRIGQKRTVYSIKLITKGTVEEKVLDMQRRKQAVIEATVASGGNVLDRMTWDDVLELLNA